MFILPLVLFFPSFGCGITQGGVVAFLGWRRASGGYNDDKSTFFLRAPLQKYRGRRFGRGRQQGERKVGTRVGSERGKGKRKKEKDTGLSRRDEMSTAPRVETKHTEEEERGDSTIVYPFGECLGWLRR